MTELTFAILKYALLALLWFFVFCVIRSLGRDVHAYSPRASAQQRRRSREAKKVAQSTPQVQPAAAAPRGGGSPTVLVIVDGPLVGVTVTLTSQPVTLGRASDNTVVLDDEFVSAHHARVFQDPRSGSWAVEDFKSTNGTFVNEQRISGAVMLPAGVPVRIGATTFELR